MPKFYFHLRSRQHHIPDDSGKELDNLNDAYEHARKLIDKILSHVGQDDEDLWKVVISNDQHDAQISTSLGLPATFQFGGLKRADPVKKYALRHGDVAVWGGPSRLCYHGVAVLKDGEHPKVGRVRINLTFRGAL